MAEKPWKEISGWEKIKRVAGIVVGVGVVIIKFTFEGGGFNKYRSTPTSGGGGSVWTRGSGGKKPGSWSSGRHG